MILIVLFTHLTSIIYYFPLIAIYRNCTFLFLLLGVFLEKKISV